MFSGEGPAAQKIVRAYGTVRYPIEGNTYPPTARRPIPT